MTAIEKLRIEMRERAAEIMALHEAFRMLHELAPDEARRIRLELDERLRLAQGRPE